MDELKDTNPDFFRKYEDIDDTEEFLHYMMLPLRQSFRVNTLKVGIDDVVERLSEEFELERVPWAKEGYFVYGEEVTNTPEFALGLIFMQEASSMIPAAVLDVQPGMLVLDMAASPGSKTTQMSAYMENRGCIVANDVKYPRINILISNIQKFGSVNVRVTMKDGRYFGRFRDTFDRVLLDAPCSNVGMIRKNYKYLRLWRQRDVEALSRLQKELIMAAYRALKPGGVLVYSTCTLDPEENEEVVDYLLSNTDARLEKIDLPLKSHEPITEFRGKIYTDEVKKCLRIHPQDNNTEGFFVAKVVKDE
ncbi:NOL1/NOP2/sun family putative RNA methylase [Geoglobus acetivorans]|uniref:NOL1/NOP2/sun family putative RNA methylase n=1 Tax=Geoglobus acetivorans TaxID=565033 RepID=A0ABZ3H2Q6_GEOAI|nr:NOL1/NOP2/sun family putative RNA methylase [Geoglobus acetivorans]